MSDYTKGSPKNGTRVYPSGINSDTDAWPGDVVIGPLGHVRRKLSDSATTWEFVGVESRKGKAA